MISEGGAARAYHMLGNYEINATVGKGGMGVVYRAHDHILNRTVALKVLREDLRAQESLVSRFEREARAVAALDHPNIVHVYSVGSIDEIPYIAMEFIEGRPLNEILKRNKRLDWEPTLSAAAQVARGLAAAHEKGIIHRDIKPGNILVTRDGHAYITDFGIAKVLSADTQLTVDGSRLGTPHYMAPERCEGQVADEAGDIYSLGIVMYQCISGDLPFDAKTPARLIEAISTKPVPRIAEKIDDVPKDVDRLVAWMTEKDPRHRPASAHVLAEAIERVAAGMPLEEEGPNLAGALAEFRDTQSTPAPSTRTPTPTSSSQTRRRVSKAVRWWNEMHLALQIFIVGALSLGIGAATTPYILPHVDQDPIQAIALSTDSGASRWQTARSPASFQDEGAGVWTARILIQDFGIAAMGSAGSRAILTLNGQPVTPWAAHRAAVTLSPGGQSSRLVVAPAAINADTEWIAAPNLLIREHADRTDFQIISANDQNTNQRSWFATDQRVKLSGVAAASVSGVIAVGVKNDGAMTGESIMVPTVGEDGSLAASPPLLPYSATIASLHFSPTEDAIVYVRDGDMRTVHITRLNGNGREAPPIADGDVRLGSQPFSSDGNLVAVVHKGDVPEIIIVGSRDGIPVGRPLPGTDAAMHADSDTLVYLSTDRHGQTQVWTYPVNGRGIPTQRTFIEGGVQPLGIAIAGDFACAAVSDADGPVVACVDLRTAP